ncbi:MAG: DUF3459 domain-containing protein [Maritimibacter sp.]
MHWDASANAGFTSGTPWLAVNPNYSEINVATDRADPDGVFTYYQKLIALRRAHPVITEGRFVPLLEDHPAIWAYSREHDGQRLTMLANLSGAEQSVELPEAGAVSGECLIANCAERSSLSGSISLAPWEAVAVIGTI